MSGHDDSAYKCQVISGTAYIEKDNGFSHKGNLITILKPDGIILILTPGIKDKEKIESFNEITNLVMSEQNGILTIRAGLPNGFLRITYEKIVLSQPLFESLTREENSHDNEDGKKSCTLDDIRKKYPNAYVIWTVEDDERLLNEYEKGVSIVELARAFQRKPGAIRSRLKKLEAYEDATNKDDNETPQETNSDGANGEEYERDIIILANSRKYKGHCIAGKDIKTGEWVRVVPDNEDHAFSAKELIKLYGDYNGPELLEVVSIPLSYKIPSNYHPEDEYINPNKLWKKVGTLNSIDHVGILLDREKNDWVTITSYKFGVTDKIPNSYFESYSLKNSLQLIKLNPKENRTALIYKYNHEKEYYKPRLCFDYKGNSYNLAITDPQFKILTTDPGPQQIGDTFIVIGLGEPHTDGYSYKLIVGTIPINVTG